MIAFKLSYKHMLYFLAMMLIGGTSYSQKGDAPVVEFFETEQNEIALLFETDIESDLEINLYTKLAGQNDEFELTNAETIRLDEMIGFEYENLYLLRPQLEVSGEYEFYVTLVNADGTETSPSRTFMFFFDAENKVEERVLFSVQDFNYGMGKKNVEYEFNVYANEYITGTFAEIEMTSSPTGADFVDGVVSFLPTEGGINTFIFEAVDKAKFPNAKYRYDVMIRECENGATATITFKDESGKLFNTGYAEVYSLNNSMLMERGPIGSEYYGEIIEGKLVLEELDKGGYLVMPWIEGTDTDYFFEDFYGVDGQIDIEDLKKSDFYFEVDCGQDFSFDIILERAYSSETFTVNGSVINENTNDPIAEAYISAYGSNDEGRKFGFSAITDSDGNFSIDLPIDLEYILLAEAYNFDENGIRPKFAREYWKEATTMLDADIIDKDFTGQILFTLAPPVPFDNSISGRVSGSEGEGLEKVQLFAFPIEIDEQYMDREYYFELYEGFPTLSDENGDYSITDLVPGKYIVMAFPFDGQYHPGFHSESGATLQWEDATVLTVDEDSNLASKDIELTKAGEKNGAGEIRGYVTADGEAKSGDKKDSESGMNGVTVMAINIETGETYSDMSDETGFFKITGLPDGEYQLSADRVGYNPDRNVVKLGESNRTLDMEMSITPKTSSVKDILTIANVYPNPTADRVTLQFATGDNASNIKVHNAQGELIYSYNGLSFDNHEVSLENEPAGMYIFSAEIDGKTYSTKVIKN
ncbi:MAG: hypothetical protein Kapaf2KO_02760 [Candidatus Kapaibacteriales bacterium]